MVEVNSAITNPLVINNLGTQAPHFNKLIELFYSDINLSIKKRLSAKWTNNYFKKK